MTKGELLRLLEPYVDDIQIFVRWDGEKRPAHVHYEYPSGEPGQIVVTPGPVFSCATPAAEGGNTGGDGG